LGFSAIICTDERENDLVALKCFTANPDLATVNAVAEEESAKILLAIMMVVLNTIDNYLKKLRRIEGIYN